MIDNPGPIDVSFCMAIYVSFQMIAKDPRVLFSGGREDESGLFLLVFAALFADNNYCCERKFQSIYTIRFASWPAQPHQ
jgi:hypothetical protein